MEQIPQHNNFLFESIEISSDFDSGNIENVEEIEKNWFALWIGHDGSSSSPTNYRSWFYYKVTTKSEKTLKFTIKNLNLQNKLFSEGMKPVYKSDNNEWKRVESKVEFQIVSDKFEITFTHPCNTKATFFAFTYPWSLSENESFFNSIQQICKDSNIYYFNEKLINSVQGRPCCIVTITSHLYVREKREKKIFGLFSDNESRCNKFANKQVVFISSRVHPGEVQSSHVLNGFVKFIVSADKRAEILRDHFIFKIVPILNPDGVFCGYYRTDAGGANLNRFYIKPVITEHPTIFAVKEVVKYYKATYDVFLYLDLHGHASKKGCFIYGNYMDFTEQIETCLFAKYLQLNCINFDFEACNFTEVNMRSTDKHDKLSKEGSGRVTFFKELNILRSYTLECNYNTGRVLNKILYSEGDLTNINSQVYSNGPPKYDISIFEDVGKAVGVALIDLEQSNPLTRIRNLNQVKLDVAVYVANMVPFRYDPSIRKACKGIMELECYLEEILKEKVEKRGFKSEREGFKPRHMSDGLKNKYKSYQAHRDEIRRKMMPMPQGSNGNLHKEQEFNFNTKKTSFLPQIKPLSNFRGKSFNRNFMKIL